MINWLNWWLFSTKTNRFVPEGLGYKTDLFEEEPEKKKDDVDSGPEEEEVRHRYADTFQNHKFLEFKLRQFFGFSTKF